MIFLALEKKSARLALLKQEIGNMTNEINNAAEYRETISSDLRRTQQTVEQIGTSLNQTTIEWKTNNVKFSAHAKKF